MTLDILLDYIVTVKVLFAVLCLSLGWYVQTKCRQWVRKLEKRMLYVYLKYSHSGVEDKTTDYKQISDIFKFYSEEELYNFIKRESNNCRFELKDIKQIKM